MKSFVLVAIMIVALVAGCSSSTRRMHSLSIEKKESICRSGSIWGSSYLVFDYVYKGESAVMSIKWDLLQKGKVIQSSPEIITTFSDCTKTPLKGRVEASCLVRENHTTIQLGFIVDSFESQELTYDFDSSVMCPNETVRSYSTWTPPFPEGGDMCIWEKPLLYQDNPSVKTNSIKITSLNDVDFAVQLKLSLKSQK